MNAAKRRPVTVDQSGKAVDPPPPAGKRGAAKIKLQTLDDVRREMGSVYRDARGGRLDPKDAARLAYVLGEMVKLLAVKELEARLAALEESTR
jgi:hypothetical protein